MFYEVGSIRTTLFAAALCVAATGASTGCDDEASDSDTGSADTGADTGGGGEEDAATTTIGPAGGLVASGGASVMIPADALAEETPISVESSTVPPVALEVTYEAASNYFSFTPHGTTFATPVTLELPFTGEATAVLRLDNDEDSTWEVVEATLGETSAEVTTSGFSYYAVVRGGGSGGGGTPTDVTFTWTLNGQTPDSLNCENSHPDLVGTFPMEILAVMYRGGMQDPYYEATVYCASGTHTFFGAPPGNYHIDIGLMAPQRRYLTRYIEDRDLTGTNLTIPIDFEF